MNKTVKKILDKMYEEEKINSKLEKRYGKGTLLLKDECDRLESYIIIQRFVAGLIILNIIYIVLFNIISREKFYMQELANIGIPLLMFIIITLGKTIYIKSAVIITPKKIIVQNAFKKDKIVTYDEINRAIKNKKIEIKNSCVYIPTNNNSIKIQVLNNKKLNKAIEVICLKSKATIPEFTELRKEYIRLAKKGHPFTVCGIVFLLIQLLSPAFINVNGDSRYIYLMFSEANLFLFIMGICCLIIGKILYALGQYKFKKDINDPEHIKIKL